MCYTDFWAAYNEIFPKSRHRSVGKKSGKTNLIERFDCTLRQRISRLVRKTLSFSKKLENHIGAIWYFIHHYNELLRIQNYYLLPILTYSGLPNPTKAQSKFNEIMQPNFWIARQELMIDRHWIVLVNAKKLPDEAKLIDAMYETVDDQKKCVMIDLTKP